MRKAIQFLSLVVVTLAVPSIMLGQKRSTRIGASKPAAVAPRIICKGQSVPKGFVIAGYKSSSKCGENSELVIKKPADAETVCVGSPIPEGYHVISQQGSATCNTADSSPLANALSITRDGSDATRTKNGDDSQAISTTRTTRVTVQIGAGDQNDGKQKPKSVVEQRAAEEQRKTEIELAVLHHQIIVGMSDDQVVASWGAPHRKDATTSSGSGTSATWTYYKGNEFVDLHFDNGILRDWTWFH